MPFYNSYIVHLKLWGNGWIFLAPIVLGCLTCIPVVGFIFSILTVCYSILHCYKMAEAFGEGVGFTIGLVLLSPIFILILAFDKKHSYLGVPVDGASYKELKVKYDNLKAKDEERISATKYEEPPVEPKRDVEYEKPADAKAEEKPEEKAEEKVEEVKTKEKEIKQESR